MVKKCRKEGYGGVALLISDDVDYEEVDLPDFYPIEAIAIETTKMKMNFISISVYVPLDHKLL